MAKIRHCAIWVILSFSVHLFLAQASQDSLRFVTALWRHGDRASSDGTFPMDTGNGDSTWPQGFGELSQIGMRQHQYLGNYLRQRYVTEYNFLSANYSAKEIYVRSSSFNRTIVSALSNMVGMYPAPTGVDLLVDIPIWQPIPVHSQPREHDPMLWMDCPCPKVADIYYNQIMKSADVQKIEADYKDFLDFLMNKTGMKQMTLDDVWNVWDPLNCEKIHNSSHKWPEWVTEPIFEKLTDLTQLSVTFYYHDPRLQRFRGSLLFNDIATRFDQKANHPKEIQPPELKYFVYSAHDMTIVALLENLGDYIAHLPEYASALLFELHEKQPNVFTVETWYVNETLPTQPPVRVIVKGCDDQPSGTCDLGTFVKLAASKAPTDWYAECQLMAPSTTASAPTPVQSTNSSTTAGTMGTSGITVQPPCSSNQPATIAAIVLGVTTAVFMVAFVLTLCLYCRLLRRNKFIH